MPRRMLSPIVSVKHYVHHTNAAIASGAIGRFVIAHSVVAPATGNAFDVQEGSVIKAVFIEFWLLSEGAAGSTTQFAVTVEKQPGNTVDMTAAQILNLGAYPNKKNIFYVTQGVMSGEDTNSVPILRQWFKIPKGKQRMGLDDQIVVNFGPIGQSTRRCGITTYKEYR